MRRKDLVDGTNAYDVPTLVTGLVLTCTVAQTWRCRKFSPFRCPTLQHIGWKVWCQSVASCVSLSGPGIRGDLRRNHHDAMQPVARESERAESIFNKNCIECALIWQKTSMHKNRQRPLKELHWNRSLTFRTRFQVFHSMLVILVKSYIWI